MFLPYLHTARIWLKLIISKAFRSSRSQMFYKIDVLKNFAKFIIKLDTCFPMAFVEFSRTFSNHPSKSNTTSA